MNYYETEVGNNEQQLLQDNEALYEYEDYPYMDQDGQMVYGDQSPEELIQYRLDTFDAQYEISYLSSNCVTAVVSSTITQLKVLVISCVIFRFAICALQYSNVESRFWSRLFLHSLSCALGVFVLYDMFQDVFQVMGFVTLGLLSVTYFCIWRFHNSSYNSGVITAFVTVAGICFGEFYYSNPKMWNRIRGVVLLMSMKVISVAVDYKSGSIVGSLPSVIEFFSYSLHPGTIVFGPWVSLQDFRESLLVKRPLNMDFLFSVLKNSTLTIVCLVLCMCVFPYLFVDPLEPQLPVLLPIVAGPWMLAYKSAVSFHFSHYYVNYLSAVTSQISGTGILKVTNKKNERNDERKIQDKNVSKGKVNKTKVGYSWSKFVVTRPLDIEIPRSMLDVVVAWNIPMSRWLKYYVFDTTRFLGNFPAILFSYAASAILHGLNLHLASILLSLCFYTYVENSLRLKLSKIFNCQAIQARPPKDVTHTPLWARLFNITWVLINLMHLAYLGTATIFQDEENDQGIEGYSISYTLEKWGKLSFASHIFATICLIFNWII